MLQMLDVAIGVTFVFLLVSLIASALVEAIEAAAKNRSKDLRDGIAELLRDNALLERVYNHPLVNGLYKGIDYATAAMNGDLPSYIPARNFALALMDIGFGGTTGALVKPPEVVPPGAAQPVPGANVGPIADMLPVPVQQTLRVLAQSAANDAARTRENIEHWYSSAMDRVSGWYKRRTQMFLFAVGLIIAGTLNIDTIHITRELAMNDALREAAVAQARQWSADNPTMPTQPQIKNLRADLDQLGLPIGWKHTPLPGDASGWALLVIGWLLTACAVSLGAPFWFDTLNKFIVVRSTVKPEEKSGTEAPKEPTK